MVFATWVSDMPVKRQSLRVACQVSSLPRTSFSVLIGGLERFVRIADAPEVIVVADEEAIVPGGDAGAAPDRSRRADAGDVPVAGFAPAESGAVMDESVSPRQSRLGVRKGGW
jgi:hypothetical protein